jgi:hypothetical protein
MKNGLQQGIMITASDICDALGRRNMAQRLGVSKTAISNAAVDGTFPARWYLVLSTMCDERGVPCPKELFSFSEDKVSNNPAHSADHPTTPLAEDAA